MKIRLSLEASDDLDEIWAYTNMNWSHTQADKYISSIIDEFDTIPSRATFRSVAISGTAYCYISFKSHYIFFELENANEMINIIRILHHKMDFVKQLA
ncbi:MAG: hypothetical protein Kapaf2KO_00190 [Candidatus Kapaibacteriales bacterium]